MRKYLLLIVLLFVVSLSACSTKETTLESRIKEFDYYTEIVHFDADHGENITLLAAYNDNSSEVSYIYYSKNIESDMEILFKIEEEIIYEDFIVREYDLGEDFIGEFTGSSLGLSEDVSKVNMRLVPAGLAFAGSVTSSYFYQEFNLINSKNDIGELNRNFVSTDDYVESEVNIIEDDLISSRSRIVVVINVLLIIVLYFVFLQVYKKLYSNMLQKMIQNKTVKVKLMDINIYKYVSAIVLFIVVIILNLISVSIIMSDYNKVDFYSKYNINYEDVSSDTINLQYGGTYSYDQNVAFVEKGSTHSIMGSVYITLDDGMLAVVPEPDYGSYNYKVTYKFITSEFIDITVKEWNTVSDNPYLEEILNRRLYFDEHR